MALPTRKLGKHSPLEVSAEGLGCMSLTPGSFYDTAGLTEEQATAVVHRAVELGVTLFNTSDLYGESVTEGRFVADNFCFNLGCICRSCQCYLLAPYLSLAAVCFVVQQPSRCAG